MRQPHPLADVPFIFVTGTGRSGTTALRTALSSHPGVLGNFRENHVAGELLTVAVRNRTMPSRRDAMQMDDDAWDRVFRSCILDLLLPDPPPEPPARVLAFIGRLTGDTPERLLGVFPGCRVVSIIRDAVQTIESRQAHGTLGRMPFDLQCRLWAEAADLARWAEADPLAVLVRHERLRTDPAGEMTRVLAALELPDDPAPAAHLLETTHHPTDPRQRPSWRNWTDDDRAVFVRVCAEGMDRFGYPIPWLCADAGQTARSAAS